MHCRLQGWNKDDEVSEATLAASVDEQQLDEPLTGEARSHNLCTNTFSHSVSRRIARSL